MTTIKIEDISFSYNSEDGETPVLKNISLEIEQGSFVSILGHNGSGKSTLAKMLNAILEPQSGRVLVNGLDTKIEENGSEIRRNVGLVFQNPDNQIVATIVEEDVAFALENLGVEPVEMRKRVDWALKCVGMEAYKNHAPHQLSGGQKQRVAIAGVIAMQPKCIVLDEPTAMLDPSGRKEVMSTIMTLNKELGITIVLITHFMDEAARAERVIVMDNGEILLDGKPEFVFQNVALLKSVGLDVPQSTELMFSLREENIKVPISVLTSDKCVEVLLELLK